MKDSLTSKCIAYFKIVYVFLDFNFGQVTEYYFKSQNSTVCPDSHDLCFLTWGLTKTITTSQKAESNLAIDF